jgi:hypothetical protein
MNEGRGGPDASLTPTSSTNRSPRQARALDGLLDPIARVLHARAGQPGQGERRESATDMRLDGDEVAPDADDGDAGHFSGTYMVP